MFPTTDISGWGEGGTQGGPFASFFRRYQGPLAAYARHRLRVDPGLAEELAARFVARELERAERGERPIFRLHDPASGRFRSLLATSFWRFARDELAKEARRGGPSLDHPDVAEEEDSAAQDAFCRLVAREFFNVVRAAIRAELVEEDALAVLELKWPADLAAEPLNNAEVQRRLGLSRSRVRTLVRRIGAGFVKHLGSVAGQAGLTPAELDPFLADACAVLDRA